MHSLFVLRHGIAEDFDPSRMKSDADRELTAEGKEKIEAQASAFSVMKLDIECVLASPYPRARQTAEITAKALDLEVEISELLTPHSWPEAILGELQKRKFERTLVVGHEPHLSSLVSRVLAGSGDISIELKKGALVGLELGKLVAPFHGTLKFSIPPKALRAIAKR